MKDVIDIEPERAGRRSDHGSSSDAWEKRDRQEEITRALAVLPEEMRRRVADPRSVVGPLVLAEEAKEREAAFQALCTAILDENDYALYVVRKQRRTERGGIEEYDAVEPRKRKSAWRKLGRYAGLDVEITKEVIGHAHNETCSRITLAKHGLKLEPGEDCGCPTVYARYHVRVTASNGRIGYGVGIASRNERAFKAQDHSLPATAYTRAVSRGISDMIGAGEGGSDDPAETVDAPKGELTARPADAKPLTTEQAQAYGLAWTGATDDLRRQALSFLTESGYKKGEFTKRGADDFDRVMEILGAAVPETAP
ncbi:MAG TPA: hypothetical protein VGS01_09560 [Candidatus Limnocylindria bacterium]|nr:hypothetical protein [Candidatus Limnocylindria bacterium]